MSDVVSFPDEVREAVDSFRQTDRNDQSERFLVLGYEGKNKLKVVASGDGGLADVAEHLVEKDASYVLLRKTHQVELATTIKFVFIDFTPQTVPPLRKALLSTHKGQVSDFLKPYHISFQWDSKQDLSEDEVADAIGASSGTKSNILTRMEASARTKKAAPKASAKKLVPDSVRDEVKIQFEDEDAFQTVLRDIRDDSTDANWVLVTYANPTTLKVHAQGAGDADELQSHLDDDQVFYGLIRTTERYDDTERVMFGFVKLLSDNVPPMQRARNSTHIGFVSSAFQPYHTEFLIDEKEKISAGIVKEKMQSIIGTRSNVRDVDDSVPKARVATKARAGPMVPRQTEQKLGVRDDVTEAISAVHRDDSPTTWMVCRFGDSNELELVGSGDGDTSKLLAALETDYVNFGIIKVTEVIDKSVTIKFVYIKCQPDGIPPTKKARIGTLKGAIDDKFRPYHVDFFINGPGELSHDEVMDKVATASGSKVHVLADEQ